MPHEKRDLGLFDEREPRLPYTMNQFEHAFKVPVQFVLFFFGLVNAGVPFGSVGSGTWIVFTGLIVGKPLGILVMTMLGVAIGLRMPRGLTYSHTLVVGLAAGIGFTVALFFATAVSCTVCPVSRSSVGAPSSTTEPPVAPSAARG